MKHGNRRHYTIIRDKHNIYLMAIPALPLEALTILYCKLAIYITINLYEQRHVK